MRTAGLQYIRQDAQIEEGSFASLRMTGFSMCADEEDGEF